MLSEAQKTFRFAIIMCVCCSIALTAASVGLKERQEENKLIDRQKNILKALETMGVKTESDNGKPPIHINGKINGNEMMIKIVMIFLTDLLVAHQITLCLNKRVFNLNLLGI